MVLESLDLAGKMRYRLKKSFPFLEKRFIKQSTAYIDSKTRRAMPRLAFLLVKYGAKC